MAARAIVRRAVNLARMKLQSTGLPTVDTELEDLHHNTLDPTENQPAGGQGQVVYGVTLAAGVQKLVAHGLGYTPRSWSVWGLRTKAVVWQSAVACQAVCTRAGSS